MGPTLPARIREALESICPSGWWILEDGRDIYKGWGQVGVPVSGRGQGRTNSGFLPEPKPRCERCQDLSPQCDEQQAHTHQDHAGAYAASHRAVREMKEAGELPGRVRVRSSQYLNNLVEQDHRRVKQRIRPMLGFKRFDNAADRKSTRLNSSHRCISYAVFCLKKKTIAYESPVRTQRRT